MGTARGQDARRHTCRARDLGLLAESDAAELSGRIFQAHSDDAVFQSGAASISSYSDLCRRRESAHVRACRRAVRRLSCPSAAYDALSAREDFAEYSFGPGKSGRPRQAIELSSSIFVIPTDDAAASGKVHRRSAPANFFLCEHAALSAGVRTGRLGRCGGSAQELGGARPMERDAVADHRRNARSPCPARQLGRLAGFGAEEIPRIARSRELLFPDCTRARRSGLARDGGRLQTLTAIFHSWVRGRKAFRKIPICGSLRSSWYPLHFAGLMLRAFGWPRESSAFCIPFASGIGYSRMLKLSRA